MMGRGRAAAKRSNAGQVRLDELLTPPRRSNRKRCTPVEKPNSETQIKDTAQVVLEVEDSKNKVVTLSKSSHSKKSESKRKDSLVQTSGVINKNANIGDQSQLLKSFDLNPTFGPCRGITRRERYLRAVHFKVIPQPDPIILSVLDEHKEESTFQNCLWDQNELLKLQTCA